MSSPATYNRNAIGTIWNLQDLPAEWPGYAILLKGDLDSDLVIEPNELDSIDWIAFSEAVGDFQEQAGVETPDSKLGPETLKLLRQKYVSQTSTDGALKTIGDLVLMRASQPVAPPSGPELVGRNDEERRICNLWNKYGAAIDAQAAQYEIPVESALAVFYVESGTAYDPATGLVIIRFEPQIFSKKTGKDVPWARGGQKTEWQNLETAYGVNPEAALLATSYGLPQLMGFNCWVTKFATVREMVLAFQDSCREQVAGFFGFVKKNSLDRYILDEDWRAFTKRYNGPGNVDDYSAKLIGALKVIDSLKQDGIEFKA
ncbi:MAG TPA: N-acetylmuramidase domain-containing protein [Geobacteraceae bacterium]